jgi:hypothetical protein
VVEKVSSYRHTGGGAVVTSEAWGEAGAGRWVGMGAPRVRVWRTGIALVAAWTTSAAINMRVFDRNKCDGRLAFSEECLSIGTSLKQSGLSFFNRGTVV